MYFGPETMMPLASAAAAVGGVVLLFWRRLVGYLRMAMRWAAELFENVVRSQGRGSPRRPKGV